MYTQLQQRRTTCRHRRLLGLDHHADALGAPLAEHKPRAGRQVLRPLQEAEAHARPCARGAGPARHGLALRLGWEQAQAGARGALSPDRRRSRSMATTRAACARTTPSPPARQTALHPGSTRARRTHLPHDLAVDDRLVARLDGGAVRQHAHLGRELVRRLRSTAATRASEWCRPCPNEAGR